jgi:ABC-type transport system substrate-binding protein
VADFGTFDPTGIVLASAYSAHHNGLLNQSSTKPEFILRPRILARMPDAQTFVFKIRPGVKVAPNDLGVPERDLDGEDVRVNTERIKTTPTANNYTFTRDYVDSVTVSGDLVTMKTTRPYAWFLNRIGLFINTIAPRELLAGDLSRLEQHAAGAGPFRLTSLEPGQHAVFDRNPNYYRRDEATGTQLPFIDQIDLKLIFDRSAAGRRSSAASCTATPRPTRRKEGPVGPVRDPGNPTSYIAFSMNCRAAA